LEVKFEKAFNYYIWSRSFYRVNLKISLRCPFKVHSALERHMEAHALAARTSPDPANIEEGRGFKVNPPCILLVPVCMTDPDLAFLGTEMEIIKNEYP
jgi:hypothetical protein